MKIRCVTVNNRKHQLVLTLHSGKQYPFPFAKLDPRPTSTNGICAVHIDRELGREAVTYQLKSNEQGTLHVEQVLEYNRDPRYMSELVIYRLTTEAQKRVRTSALSRREIARRLQTSVAQLYRLLDPGNSRKSINQLLSLLHILDCEVEFTIQRKSAA